MHVPTACIQGVRELQCKQPVLTAPIGPLDLHCVQMLTECRGWAGSRRTCSLWSSKHVTSCSVNEYTIQSIKLALQMMGSQDEVVLVGGAYADARRALQPNAAPLEWPAGWRALESCTVLEVRVKFPGIYEVTAPPLGLVFLYPAVLVHTRLRQKPLSSAGCQHHVTSGAHEHDAMH